MPRGQGKRLRVPVSLQNPSFSTIRSTHTSRGDTYKKIKRTSPKNPKIVLSSKRVKKDHVVDHPSDFFFEDFGVPLEPLKTPSSQTQNDYLRAFQERSETYLFRILASEGPDQPMKCSHCQEPGVWQCIECVGTPLYCKDCCRKVHSASPYHRVRHWNGSFFEDDWLMNVGVTLHIGHSGGICPISSESNDAHKQPLSDCANLSSDSTCGAHLTPDSGSSDATVLQEASESSHDPESAPIPVSDFQGSAFYDCYTEVWRRRTINGNPVLHVVHANGIHPVAFKFCNCSPDSQDLQLLDGGFFPASFTRIRTVFTFGCLDAYLAENLECKTPARSFWAKLCRLTNGAFPLTVPSRYRELRRVARQWRHLKRMKWHGFGHRHEKPEVGDLTVTCPICPQPGVNLPDNWEDDWDEALYMRQFAIDGNFSAVHQSQKNNNDDVWLGNGLGFMVEKDEYKEHLRVAKTYPIPRGCNNHRAATDNTEKVGCDVTGIGALCCLRNGFFIPQSVVDFQKGEQQKNIDYGVSKALNAKSMQGIRKVLLVYDIMCQWQAKFEKRFTNEPHLHLPEGMEVRKAIGDMHIRGHVWECYPRYTLAFIHGAGVIDGEILETNWAVTNEIATTVRGASLATRAEVLDDHMNYMNFKKLVAIVPTLVAKHKRAVELVATTNEAFSQIDAKCDRTLVEGWDQKAEAAQSKRRSNPKAMDYFGVAAVQVPSQASQKLKLTQEEEKGGKVGLVAFLANGIAIQEQQLSLRSAVRAAGKYRTITEETEISERRAKLREKVIRHQQKAALYFNVQPDQIPEDYEYIEDDLLPDATFDEEKVVPDTDCDIENFVIALPSTLPPDLFPTASSARKLEEDLRIGQCNDALQTIRSEIARKAFVFSEEVRKAATKRYKFRAWTHVHITNAALKLAASKYRQARRALLALDASPDIQKKYQVLAADDMQAKSTFLDCHVRGVKHDTLPWFWTVDTNGESDNDSFVDEVFRMNWIRARESRDRAVEEHKRVEHEMIWGVRYFKFKAAQWQSWEHLRQNSGHKLYARRQSHMWSVMASRAEHIFHITRNV